MLLGGCLAEKHEINADDVNAVIDEIREEHGDNAPEHHGSRGEGDDDVFNAGEAGEHFEGGTPATMPLSAALDDRLGRIEKSIGKLTDSIDELMNEMKSTRMDF